MSKKYDMGRFASCVRNGYVNSLLRAQFLSSAEAEALSHGPVGRR